MKRKIKREPLVVGSILTLVTGVLNTLVVGGVLDPAQSDAINGVGLGVLDLLAAFGVVKARSKAAPYPPEQ